MNNLIFIKDIVRDMNHPKRTCFINKNHHYFKSYLEDVNEADFMDFFEYNMLINV